MLRGDGGVLVAQLLVRVVLRAGAEAERAMGEAAGDDSLETVEGARGDEEDVCCVHFHLSLFSLPSPSLTLRPGFSGLFTLMRVPSTSLRSACWTPRPLTSRLPTECIGSVVAAILSTSSRKTIPCCRP